MRVGVFSLSFLFFFFFFFFASKDLENLYKLCMGIQALVKGLCMTLVFWNFQNSLREDQTPRCAQCTRQDEVGMGRRTHCPGNHLSFCLKAKERNPVEWASTHRVSSQLAEPVEGRQRSETGKTEAHLEPSFLLSNSGTMDRGSKCEHDLQLRGTGERSTEQTHTYLTPDHPYRTSVRIMDHAGLRCKKNGL